MKRWSMRLSLVVLLAGLVATAPRAAGPRTAGPGAAVPAAGATGPSGPSQTQSGTWEVVSSPTANDLWGVDMVSADEGWAVGQGGTMVRYRNGQWQTAPGQIVDMLHAVDMVSAGDGWAVGGGGEDTIYHYGGGSWQAIEPTGYWLNDVHMVTAYLGWAVGSGGTILKYSVGTWQASFLPTYDNLNSVDVFSSSSAWAVGDVIARYSGGGWQVVASPTSKSLRSVDMMSSTEGWAVGETGTILHYSGGQWQQVSSPTSQWLHSVHMVSADEGWAVGVGGTILHYSGGAWQLYSSPTGNALLDVTMVSADEGWAVGASGTILHYTTPEPPSAQFSGDPRSGPAPLAVQFSDESSGQISAWDWNFGDGASSSAQNPAHTYARPGKYRVSLTVTGPGGSDTETKVGYISVTGLAYAGQSFLPFVGPLPPGVPAVVIDEEDGRITTGDHVMMSLPFKNIGPQTISNA